MQTTLQTLIDQASQPDMPRTIRLLARNQALDMVDIRSTHPNVAQCGGQIASGMLPIISTDYTLPAPSDTASKDEREAYHDRLQTALVKLMQPLRDKGYQGEQSTRTGKIQLTRFIDLHTVYSCWCGYTQPATAEQKYERFVQWDRQIKSRISPKRQLPRLSAVPLLYLARDEWRAVVWATEGVTMPEISDYTAREWVHRLALPGYENEQDYQQKAGLVAVEYALEAQQLYKPTVVEAGTNAYYFPGYRHEPHGRTASFDQHNQAPWRRAESDLGLIEYIHTNMTLDTVQPRLRYLGSF